MKADATNGLRVPAVLGEVDLQAPYVDQSLAIFGPPETLPGRDRGAPFAEAYFLLGA